jgi:MFS family permease
MQPRVVTFSNFDEVAIDCSTTDQDSRSVTNRTIDSWERFDPEQEKKPDAVQEVELPEPEPTQYLYGLPLIAVTAALSLTVFLVAMDVNVIATAVPHITADFDSLDDVGWYGSAFLMTTCAFQILFGRIYTIYPAKFIFLGSIVIFMCGSLACALAPISTVFVIGRAIQGIGTSGILSGGLIIISQVVPLQTRSVLGGVIGAMEGVAMICAPIIGGALTDKLNWRWCFYINLPIGGCVLLVVFFFLVIPEANRPQQAVDRTWLETCYHLDVIGAALLVPPIVCLLLGLQYGGKSTRKSLIYYYLCTKLFLSRYIVSLEQHRSHSTLRLGSGAHSRFRILAICQCGRRYDSLPHYQATFRPRRILVHLVHQLCPRCHDLLCKYLRHAMTNPAANLILAPYLVSDDPGR